MGGEGFEPPEVKPADLQSALVGHLSIRPKWIPLGERDGDPTMIARRAGPRLFHNMRASCAIDWAEALPTRVPAHVVAKRLGHSPLVAAKHDLQTREAHCEVAIRGGAWTAFALRT